MFALQIEKDGLKRISCQAGSLSLVKEEALVMRRAGFLTEIKVVS